MIRTLCTAVAVLAIGAGSAGVANASMVSPLLSADGCGSGSLHKVGDKCVPINNDGTPGASGSQGDNDDHHGHHGNHGGFHAGGPRGGSHEWHGRWDRRFDHGRTLDFDGIVVDFGAYPTLAAFRASDLYRLGSVEFRGACDEALRVRSFELRHGAVVANVVIPAGLSLVRGHYLNLAALGVAGVVGDVDVCSYGDWNAFDRYAVGRFHDHWGHARGRWGHDPVGVWRSLRSRASCAVNSSAIVVAPQSSTTVINQAAPASAPSDDESSSSSNGSPDVTYSAPASTGGQVSKVPSGYVDAGDGSTEI